MSKKRSTKSGKKIEKAPQVISATKPNTKKRIIGIGVLIASTIAAIVPNKCEQTRDPKTITEENPLKHPQFNPKTYSPPQEGQIVSATISDKNAKTVIFIPDIHAKENIFQSTGSIAPDNAGLKTQKEIYAIVTDAISKYGQIPLAIESWSDHGDKTFQINVGQDFLTELASNKSEKERKAVAEKSIGKDRIPAGSLLAATYQDTIIPIPTHNQEDELENAVTASNIISFSELLEKNESCETIPGIKSTLHITDAAALFETGNKSKPVLDCWCAYQTLYRDFHAKFFHDRTIKVPQTEASHAFQYPSDLVMAIGGVWHSHAFRKKIKDLNANIIVVSPQTALPYVKDSIDGMEYESPYLDDNEQTCAKWEKLNSNYLNKAKNIIQTHIRNKMQQILKEEAAKVK